MWNFKSTYFEERSSVNGCFWKRVHETEKHQNLLIRSFNFASGFFNINIRNKFMNGTSWLVSHFIFTYNISLNKRRSKVQEKNMSCERALNVDQWKTISQWKFDYGFFTKFTENYCRSRLFSEFIQTQKRYPTSLDQIRILTWKLLVISS